MPISVRRKQDNDQKWVSSLLSEQWGNPLIITRGVSHDASRLPAFVAELDGKKIGLLTYHIKDKKCEVVSMNATTKLSGVGTALLNAIVQEAKSKHCEKLWLITTNDNLDALRFYQRRQFCLVAIHSNVIEKSRRIKPEMPLIGCFGITIRDELELERSL